MSACPPAVHNQIQNLYDQTCALVPPSPPRPPRPPPLNNPVPNPPPPPPPPTPYFEARTRDGELDSDPDCIPVTYNTCRGAVADHAKEFGTADVLTVSFAPCEGTELETGCFFGCSYGGKQGGHFHAVLSDMEREFNTSNPKRCSMSDRPFCACANAPTTYHIFPPPPPYMYDEQFHGLRAYEEGETTLGGAEMAWNPDLGQASALVKRLVNARTLSLSLRQSHRSVNCPGADDGELSCARNCAAEHLTDLRAFTVTGDYSKSPPPSQPPPYEAPSPPLPPRLPFNRCSNECAKPETALGDTRCHDGGKVCDSHFKHSTHHSPGPPASHTAVTRTGILSADNVSF